MKACIVCCVFVLVSSLSSCTQSQQTKVDERSEELKHDVRKAAGELKAEAQHLGNEAKRGSQQMADKVQMLRFGFQFSGSLPHIML